MKIIISILVLSFTHLTYAWEPSKDTCTADELRTTFRPNSLCRCTKTNAAGVSSAKLYQCRGSRQFQKACKCTPRQIIKGTCTLSNWEEHVNSAYDSGDNTAQRREMCAEWSRKNKLAESEEKYNKELGELSYENWEPNEFTCDVSQLKSSSMFKCSIIENGQPTKVKLVNSEERCVCPAYTWNKRKRSQCEHSTEIVQTFSHTDNLKNREERCVAWRKEQKTKEDEKVQLAEIKKQMRQGRRQCQIERQVFSENYNEVATTVENMSVINHGKEEKIRDLNKQTTHEADQLKDRFRQFKDKTMRELGQYEENISEENQEGFQEVLNHIRTLLTRWEEIEFTEGGSPNNVCLNRYDQHKEIKDNCYNEALAEVTEERNQYYNELYLKKHSDMKSLSNAFFKKFSSRQEKHFTKLLNEKTSECLKRDRGQIEIGLPLCTLNAMKSINESCSAKSLKGCPAGKALEIEENIQTQLATANEQREKINEELNDLYNQLSYYLPQDSLITHKMKTRKKSFDKEYALAMENHQQAQLVRFHEIDKIKDSLQEKMEKQDLRRHLSERWKFAHNLCCEPVSQLKIPLASQVDTETEVLGDSQFCTALNKHKLNPNIVKLVFTETPQTAMSQQAREGKDTKSSGQSGSR